MVDNLAQSKGVQLPYSLVENGRVTGPPNGDYSLLLKLFPTTFGVELSPPHLIIRLKTLPPKPWPLTIGGLPVQFTTENLGDSFSRGRLGRGASIITDLDFSEVGGCDFETVGKVVRAFKNMNIKIRDIFWFSGFWQITITEGTDIKDVPHRIAGSPAFYQTPSDVPYPSPATFKGQPPAGVQFDDTNYATAPNALLRPGIILSSSLRGDNHKSTTSGILVADQDGQTFITVATHGFEADGLIWHPTPRTGSVIGRIVRSLSGTGISIARLSPVLSYINESFETPAQPNGVKYSGFSPDYHPHLKHYQAVSTNNPFSGSSEGLVMALGATIVDEGPLEYVGHELICFENGDEQTDGSCGCPIADGKGNIVGLFRFKLKDSDTCFSVSVRTLRDYGYEICGGQQVFT